MSQEVKVREIEYLLRDAEETLVYLTDGVYECVAFCQPCEKMIGDVISQPLLAFETQGIALCDAEVASIQRIGSTFGHSVCARVKNDEVGLLEVGSILLELDSPLPGGIETGCFVSFTCQRVDLF